ncbi:CRISPR-associated protein, Cmr3 family [Clostridium sp. DSM 8431]|uniref:type III-B CRISPR module-associated Cmr3 family protein n=1 Tax=Clostridium sp. DSM 8431 TaxID=1761781 RepID=UPI0008EDC02B|nr:type III-B CRISPR module-associated Cmr3 family protein [Clostridium sp. DSM 8431]SFU71089.1 CRISPR-associated protein, Cmr3 family [Clostridium sp. DSM 8431]
MAKYLAELKPIGSFFFGGERTQRDGDSLKNNIVSSNIFPQQTSILGMLRKKVLIEYDPKLYKVKWDYKSEEKEIIAELIGKRSFQNIDAKEAQDFKFIKKISPTIISCKNKDRNEKKFLMPVPKDHKCYEEKQGEGGTIKRDKNKYYTPLRIEQNSDVCKVNYGDGELENTPIPLDYKNKDGISNDFVVLDKNKNIVDFDEIFKLESNIGINLGGVYKTNDNGLFRINRYRFNEGQNYKDIKFAFTVEFDDKYTPQNRSIVNLGGEGTSFILELKKIYNENIPDINKIFKECITDNKLILLSNTFLKYEEYTKLCSYSISSTQDFRCLKLEFKKINCGNYSNRFIRSEKKYSLLERGSILYAKNGKYEELKNTIEKYNNMSNIGYNHIIGGGK